MYPQGADSEFQRELEPQWEGDGAEIDLHILWPANLIPSQFTVSVPPWVLTVPLPWNHCYHT